MPLSPGHFWLALIVLAIVLIIWGPGKLGDIGGAMGRGLKEFRKASSETKEQFTSAVKQSAPPPEQPKAGEAEPEENK
jgi:sec-independent protein translocase protein TatA